MIQRPPGAGAFVAAAVSGPLVTFVASHGATIQTHAETGYHPHGREDLVQHATEGIVVCLFVYAGLSRLYRALFTLPPQGGLPSGGEPPPPAA
jgi:hypothetical protein